MLCAFLTWELLKECTKWAIFSRKQGAFRRRNLKCSPTSVKHDNPNLLSGIYFDVNLFESANMEYITYKCCVYLVLKQTKKGEQCLSLGLLELVGVSRYGLLEVFSRRDIPLNSIAESLVKPKPVSLQPINAPTP